MHYWIGTSCLRGLYEYYSTLWLRQDRPCPRICNVRRERRRGSGNSSSHSHYVNMKSFQPAISSGRQQAHENNSKKTRKRKGCIRIRAGSLCSPNSPLPPRSSLYAFKASNNFRLLEPGTKEHLVTESSTSEALNAHFPPYKPRRYQSLMQKTKSCTFRSSKWNFILCSLKEQ